MDNSLSPCYLRNDDDGDAADDVDDEADDDDDIMVMTYRVYHTVGGDFGGSTWSN